MRSPAAAAVDVFASGRGDVVLMFTPCGGAAVRIVRRRGSGLRNSGCGYRALFRYASMVKGPPPPTFRQGRRPSTQARVVVFTSTLALMALE